MFHIRRSIRYNSRREAFFAMIEKVSSLILILSAMLLVVLGAGGVVGPQLYSSLVGIVSVLVAILSGVVLVYRPGVRALEHKQFVKEFTRLEQRLTADGSETNCGQVKHDYSELELTEPPVKKVVDVLSHNEVCRAQGEGPDEFVTIGRWQRFTAHFLSWAGHDFKKGSG